MYIYIAYRDLKFHYSQNSAFGGVPVNNDYRFTVANDGIKYLLTKNGASCAVSKEDGDKFIEEVMKRCGGEHPGYFPLIPSLNGKDTAAVIEKEREVESGNHTMKQTFYYDMDDEVLLQMLDSLKERSGAPMDERALMNYNYPNSVLPEEDFELDSIYHGIYCKPENKSNSVIQTVFPDKRSSCFRQRKDHATVVIREGDNKVTYYVPADLIPEIKEKVRTLCSNPAEAYVEHGEWEGFIRFGKNGENRIFTDPDKTLELLKDIASKSEVHSTEAVDTKKYYPVGKVPASTGLGGFFTMTGTAPFAAGPATAPAQPAGPKCIYCGADVTGMKFCSECGKQVGG